MWMQSKLLQSMSLNQKVFTFIKLLKCWLKSLLHSNAFKCVSGTCLKQILCEGGGLLFLNFCKLLCKLGKIKKKCTHSIKSSICLESHVALFVGNNHALSKKHSNKKNRFVWFEVYQGLLHESRIPPSGLINQAKFNPQTSKFLCILSSPMYVKRRA